MNFNFSARKKSQGIALVIVMVTVFVLTAIVAAFALSMKVEMKLARNATSESEMEWLGRSGVDLAKYVLALQMNSAQEQYDSLNQTWAGGPGSELSSNSPISGIVLKDHEFKLGSGTFRIAITDMERKFNINTVANSPDILGQAFVMMGVDAGEYPQIVAAIQDWIDTDDDEHISGAESDFYQTLTPPYLAKNGAVDDITELLLIKGVTPAMFWGSGSTNVPPVETPLNPFDRSAIITNQVGLVDLFTPVSSGYLNLNTVSAETMQLFPGFDATMADMIIQLRAGPDGVDGTEDDTPFGGTGGSVQNALAQATGSQTGAQRLGNFFRPRSVVFEVEVTATIGGYSKIYTALVARNSAQDVQTLTFREK